MALFARTRNHAREVELEQRVNALQVALNQCKGVARQWWGFRARFTVGVAVVALAIGFTLGVYRHAIKEAFVASAAAVGLAGPQRDAAAEAEAAFQKGDYAKALKLAQPLADAGDPRAEAIIGLAYYRGRGAPHDDAEAAKWLKPAAEKGNAVAGYTLGVMYGEGRGVPQDFAEAARWYRAAAERG
jgi:Sel1 repeat